MGEKYVIGLDYGTDSVRALLINALTGEEIASSVHAYRRWKEGKYCQPAISQFRQHPLDYIEGMEETIKDVVSKVPSSVLINIKALAIDTTGSTPVAVNEKGIPLAMLPEFSENPNAMFILWKDHTANREADEINQLARNWSIDFTKYSGGIYSSEWFWSKILRTIRIDEDVFKNAYSWVEHCDWMPALLTGVSSAKHIKRGRCTAGHKAMWHEEFGGLPSQEFLTTLDPKLEGIRVRLYTDTYTSDQSAGKITEEWAKKLGLPENVEIAIGALDAHFGAVGACIEPYSLVKVIGTSTCDMVIAPLDKHKDHLVKGICGQVDGSIVPGYLGLEAGQSAFGDLYAWFKQLLLKPFESLAKDKINQKTLENIADGILPYLSEEAAKIEVTENDIIALDWINGRRTPDVNHNLKSALYGLALGTGAAELFKALVEATAFGARAISERFIEEGIPIRKVIAIGGISKKSNYVMQTLADVLNMEIQVVSSEQTCALGSAMIAATVAGIYTNVEEAQSVMSSGFDATYKPNANRVLIYNKLYQEYLALGKVKL
ncbi:L-ribulokinase [Pseudopedobacter saltans DSM 12145]|uniref:Ribulokinase n=1 Tax=Pseudopedobacter saltans (strain ATCC 51119 / DSM 12145 / JCM 21818 / CCUG 39354 / LMG 10337 / NBRC 100064 / NCIMB 13643) TaxID=762903 RepID=F0S5A0_PSESL|nr:ribulokinase [Pseudopedobacter saltans]ADY52045.1 L-ribulokinase [Pseudopedobacter saltans DSM 12145]